MGEGVIGYNIRLDLELWDQVVYMQNSLQNIKSVLNVEYRMYFWEKLYRCTQVKILGENNVLIKYICKMKRRNLFL